MLHRFEFCRQLFVFFDVVVVRGVVKDAGRFRQHCGLEHQVGSLEGCFEHAVGVVALGAEHLDAQGQHVGQLLVAA